MCFSGKMQIFTENKLTEQLIFFIFGHFDPKTKDGMNLTFVREKLIVSYAVLNENLDLWIPYFKINIATPKYYFICSSIHREFSF